MAATSGNGTGFTGDLSAERSATAFRVLCLLAVCFALANCAGTPTFSSANKYGVRPSPKVIADGEPVPKGGGRAMVGKPYVVGGQTYIPHGGKGYLREGYASWYGAAFHGRLTANGEVFDKESVAAAHPTLPLPSYVRVTNTANQRSLIVRVNDRGPYERGRMLDVSERVAEALQFHRKGTTKVRVEYVGPASLKGSDDRKLLATLRMDAPASGFPPKPTMLASLDHTGVAPRPAPAATRLAGASSAPGVPLPAAKVELARVAAEAAKENDEDMAAASDPIEPSRSPPRAPYRPVLAAADPAGTAVAPTKAISASGTSAEIY